MKKFKINFYISSVLTFLIIVIVALYIFDLSPVYSIALISLMLFLQIVYTFIFMQFHKGILLDGNMYSIPTFFGELNIQKDDIKSMLVTKGGWGRILDFSMITIQLKGGSTMKFVLPSGLVFKMGDYSVLN